MVVARKVIEELNPEDTEDLVKVLRLLATMVDERLDKVDQKFDVLSATVKDLTLSVNGILKAAEHSGPVDGGAVKFQISKSLSFSQLGRYSGFLFCIGLFAGGVIFGTAGAGPILDAIEGLAKLMGIQ